MTRRLRIMVVFLVLAAIGAWAGEPIRIRGGACVVLNDPTDGSPRLAWLVKPLRWSAGVSMGCGAWSSSVLVAEIRDRGAFQQVNSKNGDLFLGSEALPGFHGHGETTARNCTLFERAFCPISTEAK